MPCHHGNIAVNLYHRQSKECKSCVQSPNAWDRNIRFATSSHCIFPHFAKKKSYSTAPGLRNTLHNWRHKNSAMSQLTGTQKRQIQKWIIYSSGPGCIHIYSGTDVFVSDAYTSKLRSHSSKNKPNSFTLTRRLVWLQHEERLTLHDHRPIQMTGLYSGKKRSRF
jgi:hypothetical protein